MEIFSYVSQSRPIIGFLGKDPEKRQVRGNGDTFTVLSVATQQSWKDANDEWQSKTEWHRVVAFNRLATALADTLHKATSSCRWNARQFEIRARERQEQEGQDREGHVLERAREFRAQAEPCRGGAANGYDASDASDGTDAGSALY